MITASIKLIMIITCKKINRMRIKPFHFLVGTLSLFISVSVFGQQPVKNYEKEWNRVESLIKKNFPKSAVEQVKKIYQFAKSNKQDAQLIKSLVYIISLQSESTENSDVKAIADFEEEVGTATEPARSILNS